MFEIIDEQCPYCGSKLKSCIGISSSADYTNLIAYPIGSIGYIHACLECGNIYLPEQFRKRLMDKLEGK